MSSNGAEYDTHIFAKINNEQYDKSIPSNDDEMDDIREKGERRLVSSFTAPKEAFADLPESTDDALLEKTKSRTISDREDSYRARRRNRLISPERVDAFQTDGNEKENPNARSYKEIMQEQQLIKEEKEVKQKIEKKMKEEEREKREKEKDRDREQERSKKGEKKR